METRIVTAVEELPSVAAALAGGALAALPTETVYGLCANALDEAAVAALYELKGRPAAKPLSLMVAGTEKLEEYASAVPPAARTLAERFWPGPLTIVLPARTERIPGLVLAGGNTVGLRCPAHPLTLALLRTLGLPLAGPSANPSGAPSPTDAAQVLAYFDGSIPYVVDGGPCGLAGASTVLDMSTVPFRILRQGALSRESIQAGLVSGLRVIGVTGGSGTGKSTAASFFAEKGALWLDCDAVYHELLESSEELRRELRERFPSSFQDGRLDRKLLGAVVFAVPEALADLNAITHRYVRAEVHRRLLEHVWRGGDLAVIDAVALLESGMGADCMLTVGLTAPRELRLRRIMERDGVDMDRALARIEAQPEDGFYRERCDVLLDGGGSREQLRQQCEEQFKIWIGA